MWTKLLNIFSLLNTQRRFSLNLSRTPLVKIVIRFQPGTTRSTPIKTEESLSTSSTQTIEVSVKRHPQRRAYPCFLLSMCVAFNEYRTMNMLTPVAQNGFVNSDVELTQIIFSFSFSILQSTVCKLLKARILVKLVRK